MTELNNLLSSYPLSELLLLIVGMAVGYAALSQALVINGTATITTQWNIEFTNITEGKMVGAETATPPSYTATTATFNVNLLYPGATAEYKISVANKGNIDAILVSVDGIDTANAAEPQEIVYSIDAAENDELKAGSTKDYIVTVTWKSNSDVPTTKSKVATITLNYNQAD
mgnify:CR=1 FL=1